jgi:hypothetical protein
VPLHASYGGDKIRTWAVDEARRRMIGGSWELRKEENRETWRINHYIVKQIHRETSRVMDERPGAPWMCCFSEGGPVLGRLEDGRVKLTEFVKKRLIWTRYDYLINSKARKWD